MNSGTTSQQNNRCQPKFHQDGRTSNSTACVSSALYRRHSFVMRIYSDRVSVEEGFWSKDSSEFFIKDIRAIEVRQGVWGRLVGIGDVTISTAATVEAAEVARGVAQPKRIKELLISQRQQSPT